MQAIFEVYRPHFAFLSVICPWSSGTSFKGQSITIKQAIQLIEKNSSYTFFYNAADLKNTKTRNINCSGTINEVLNEVFKGSGVSYTIKGNEVILDFQRFGTTI